MLFSTQFTTPLGPMLAISDDERLYLLAFLDDAGLHDDTARLTKAIKTNLSQKETAVHRLLQTELSAYFKGEFTSFKTPVHLTGSSFQKTVWVALQAIPFATTRSYLEIAKKIDKPTAYRAVAQANGANTLAIIVPCHRVINANGQLGGYASGIARKQWLLAHEKNANIHSPSTR